MTTHRARSRRIPDAAVGGGVIAVALVVWLLARQRWPEKAVAPVSSSSGLSSDHRGSMPGPVDRGAWPESISSAAGPDWVLVKGRRFPAKPPPLPRGELHPRDPSEWQGMLVEMSVRAYCEDSASCGLAAACVKNLCGPCESDSDCAPREVCVLDHCLKRDNVRCRRRRDCASRDEYCLLTGFSPDPRGNGEMRAICQSERGGTWLGDRKPPAPRPVDSSGKPQIQESVADGLLRDLDEVKP
jgi:hypothetical protein